MTKTSSRTFDENSARFTFDESRQFKRWSGMELGKRAKRRLNKAHWEKRWAVLTTGTARLRQWTNFNTFKLEEAAKVWAMKRAKEGEPIEALIEVEIIVGAARLNHELRAGDWVISPHHNDWHLFKVEEIQEDGPIRWPVLSDGEGKCDPKRVRLAHPEEIEWFQSGLKEA